MFFAPYLTVFALLAPVLASPHKRVEAITVDVTTSPAVDSVDELKLTATVTNTGAEAVRILKYGTVLDEKLPTKSFVVTKDGQAVKFTGIKLSVSLPDADETAFTTIAPGEQVTVSHDVASLFDFSSVGAGTFKFAPITNFVVSNTIKSKDTATVNALSAGPSFSRLEAASNAVEVTIKNPKSKRAESAAHLERRAKDICTTSSKKSFIDASYTEAKTLANAGTSYISSKGASDSVYKAYFGTTSTSKVSGILSAVANENSSSRTLSCTDSLNACSSGVIAYTATATTNIYFCSIFFNEVATSSLCSGTTVASRNVRGGTTLHELTHAVGGTDDIGYGCSADQSLSTSNKAINADNYNCFTTQVYQNTKC
ncbi:Metalloprotease [Agrocybe pediades]|nr:Metalloprotease [Agrocybe pediades]